MPKPREGSIKKVISDLKAGSHLFFGVRRRLELSPNLLARITHELTPEATHALMESLRQTAELAGMAASQLEDTDRARAYRHKLASARLELESAIAEGNLLEDG